MWKNNYDVYSKSANTMTTTYTREAGRQVPHHGGFI